MTAELFRERLGGSRRAVKVALLDQRAVAGIGNLYASEILHLAEHSSGHALRQAYTRANGKRLPTRRMRCSKQRFATKARRSATARIATRSTKTGDYQNHHRVYDRAGEAVRGAGRERRACGSCRRSGRRSFVQGVSESSRHSPNAVLPRGACTTLQSRHGFALMNPVAVVFDSSVEKKDWSWNRGHE